MRIRALLLALVLLLCPLLPAAADSAAEDVPTGVGLLLETEKMYPVAVSLVPLFERSPADWTVTSLERATFSVCMWADLIAYIGPDNAFSPDILGDSWVGLSGNVLYLLMRTEGEYDLVALYVPETSTRYALFELMDTPDEAPAAQALAELCADGFWQNDLEEIKAVASALADASK